MPSSVSAQISTLTTGVVDLTHRVAALAHDLDREATQQVAADLFEAERLLRNATRRLERALRRATAS